MKGFIQKPLKSPSGVISALCALGDLPVVDVGSFIS